MLFRKVVPGSTSKLAFIDHDESYGRRVLERTVKTRQIRRCVDIGSGGGADLSIVARHFPQAELFGIDCDENNLDKIRTIHGKGFCLDIERERLPFDNDSIDFVIANQVFEHAKEIFWLNHEIFRCLSVGGFLFIGVPNLLSLHNRALMGLGYHPTTAKSFSAHVRSFSKRDIVDFYKHIGSDFCRVSGFWGSQFYPFPRPVARLLSRVVPSLAYGIFFLIEKTARYDRAFLEWPSKARLETNFFVGRGGTEGT